MRLVLALALIAPLAACQVETFYVPIEVSIEADGPADTLVIQNINAPYACRLVPADAAYAAVFAKVFGPATRAEADRWADTVCKVRQ